MQNEIQNRNGEPSDDGKVTRRRDTLRKMGKFAAYAAPFTILALTKKAEAATGHGPGKGANGGPGKHWNPGPRSLTLLASGNSLWRTGWSCTRPDLERVCFSSTPPHAFSGRGEAVALPLRKRCALLLVSLGSPRV